MICGAAERRAVRHTRFLCSMRASHHRGPSRLFLIALVAACWVSSRPGKVVGPLAAAAESIAGRVERLTCVGPLDCHGRIGDTLAYYRSREDGHVEFVARQWSIDIDSLAKTTDSIISALNQRYGQAKHCQTGHFIGKEEIWAWSSSTRTFILSWVPPKTDPSPFYAMLRLVEMLPDQPCDRDTDVLLFA